jgi:REP element-mobilizing transposase RayT
MPDHVHILATPTECGAEQWFSLSKLLHSVKRHSARRINEARGRTSCLWQSESFDRMVRDEKEFREKAEYILNNAVKSGVAADGWEYDGFWCEHADSVG